MTATAFILTHRSDRDRTRYSASLQALALTRSLGRRGVRVVRVHPGKRELSLTSRYCWRAENAPNVHESEAALLDFLLELAGKYSGQRVLLPASDDTAYFLGCYRDRLSAAYCVVAPSSSTIETIIDKQRQYEAAQRLGIPIPETYFPRNRAEVQELALRLTGYPYIIKPNVAHRWRLSGVKQQVRERKAVLAQDAHTLIAEYLQIVRTDANLMIQKVIGGPDEQLFGFFGYFDRRSHPLGFCVRKKFRQIPLRFGYCTLIESCENETVVRQSVHLLQGLDYHGIVGVEWKYDPDSREYKLLEINARATNTSALPPACGVDLPYIAFADSVGQRLYPVTRWRSGVKWLWFSGDLSAALALRRLGELTPSQWITSLRGRKVYAVHATDDFKPFLVDFGMFIKSKLGRRLQRFAAWAAKTFALPFRRPT